MEYQAILVAQARTSTDAKEHVYPAMNDTTYLTQLGLIRGHLNVGFDLCRQGAIDAAKTHMKHPGDELYVELGSAFNVRGVTGVAQQLETLATLVEGESDLAEVREAYADLEATILAAECGTSADDGRKYFYPKLPSCLH